MGGLKQVANAVGSVNNSPALPCLIFRFAQLNVMLCRSCRIQCKVASCCGQDERFAFVSAGSQEP